jgi:hypothetical protein
VSIESNPEKASCSNLIARRYIEEYGKTAFHLQFIDEKSIEEYGEVNPEKLLFIFN